MNQNIMAIIINGNYGVGNAVDGQMDFLMAADKEKGIEDSEILSYTCEQIEQDLHLSTLNRNYEALTNVLHEEYYRKYMEQRLSRILSGMSIQNMKEMQLGYLLTQINCIVIRISDSATTIYMPFKGITEKQKKALYLSQNYIPDLSFPYYMTSICTIEKTTFKGKQQLDYTNVVEGYFTDTVNTFLEKKKSL